MARFGTTTWRGRNYQRLNQARVAAEYAGISRPVILDYGPGGAVDFLFDWLPEGEKNSWHATTRIQRGVVKAAETFLRKTDLFSLRTSEPEEIASVFEDLSPEVIYVFDKEARVIDAVRRLQERNGCRWRVRYEMIDIEREAPRYRGDIVIAYYLFERVRKPADCLEAIAKTVRPNGLLSTTGDSVPSGFREIGRGLYQRIGE